MASVLKKIQDTVVKYAEIISQVLKVDIEIVDAQLVRIAGTGKYMDTFDICVQEEGHIYKHTIKKGMTQVIEDPVENILCRDCSSRHTCNEKLIACTPIKMEGEVIGVIGLICFTDEQKDWFVKNFSTYASFLEQIADFMAIKAYETLENERSETMVMLLNAIVEKLDDAIVVISKDGHISHMNHEAEKILKTKIESRSAIHVETTGNEWLGLKEYKIETSGVSRGVVGSMHMINIKAKQYDKMFIFNDTQTVKNKILSISNGDNKINIDHILGDSPQMVTLKNKVLQIAKSTSTVLITGESGTGKEMFARAIHSASDRKNEPFVAINCGAIPDTLLESELFGYDKGAFTGASQTGKIGKFEFANKGTIFLDEIGDMPLYMQVKLLRVLQEREIVKIGGNKPVKVDIRVIAATNKHLEQMMLAGSFRKDLFYRLNVIPLDIPPLRERREDIQSLITHFIHKYSSYFDKHFVRIEKGVLDQMQAYDWFGNIRELENTIEFMVNMMDDSGVMTMDTLPAKLLGDPRDLEQHETEEIQTFEDMEKTAIQRALKKYGNHAEGKVITAKNLGSGSRPFIVKFKGMNLSNYHFDNHN